MPIAPPSVGGGGQGGGRAGGPRTVASSPADLARLERTTRNLEALYRGAGQAGTALASLAREMGAMTVQARAGAVGVREFTDALRGLQGQLRQGLASLAPASAREMAQAQQQRPSSFGMVAASAALASGLAATLGGSIPLELINPRREVTAERTPRPRRMDGMGQSRSRDRNRAARRDDVKAGIDLQTASREELVDAGIGLGEKKVDPFLASRAARPFDSLADVRARRLGVTADALDKLPEPSVTAGQQVAKDSAQHTRELARQVELARERAKFLGTRAGAQSLAEQVRLTKELEAAQRRLDPMGAKKPGGGGGGGGGFADFAAASQQGFIAASAGILALTSAANPLAINTFRASVEGLAISVGGSLGPGMVQVSGYVQRFADWIDRLDPALKSNVANMALWATGILGASFAVTKLVAGVRLVGTVMSAGFLGPWGAGILGLTTLVGGLAAAWHFAGQRASEAGSAMEGAGRAGVGSGPDGGPGGGGPNRVVGSEDLEWVRRYGPQWRRRIDESMGRPDQLRQVIGEFGGQVERDAQQARQESLRFAGLGNIDREVVRMQEMERARLDARFGEGEGGGERRAASAESVRRIQALWSRVAPDLPMQPMQQDWISRYLNRTQQGTRWEVDRPTNPGLHFETQSRLQRNLNEMVGGNGWQPWTQRLLQRLGLGAGEAGAPGLPGTNNDPRLSLKWLPQSRQFSDMTGYSEYLQGQSLQPMGAQDIVNEIARLRNVTETLGGILDKVKDNTGEQGPLVRALGGW